MTDRPSAPMTLPKKPLCVDRVIELAHVDELAATAIANGTPFLLLLTGRQGIGKTTLATILGYRYVADFPDGVLYCDTQGSDPALMVGHDELARQLLVQLRQPWQAIPAGAPYLVTALRDAIAGKRLLLVFDDVGAAEQIVPLLGDVSRCAVIVTSRGRLRTLQVNHQFEVVELTSFDEPAAIDLLTSIAGDLVAGIARDALAQLNAVCDGLPLALAVSAGRLGDGDEAPEQFIEHLTLGPALEELELDGDFLVKTLFAAAYRDLPPDEARVYRLLSRVPGPHFGVSVAAAVLESAERDARRLLGRLARRHDLQDMGDGRYRYHNLVREHATGVVRTEVPGEERAAELRALTWYVRRAVALDKAFARRPIPLGGDEFYATVEPAFSGENAAARAATEFDLEWQNFLAAARRCAELGQDTFAITLSGALWSFAYQSRRCTTLIDICRRALDFATTAPVRWQLQRDLAGLYAAVGEYTAAENHLRLAKDAGYPRGTASLLEWWALSCEARGLLADAVAALAEALAAVPLMADPVQEERAVALIRMHLGRINVTQCLIDAAQPELELARGYFVSHHADARNAALCAELLGDIARARGQSGDAETWWRSAAEVLVAHRMVKQAARTLTKLADLADEQGRAEDAESCRARVRALLDGQPDD